jgi:hypothetical protein
VEPLTDDPAKSANLTVLFESRSML